ncbi:TIGR02444 family protein [Neptuniibacter sp.]|uniref:TIGR02444 family protein n=1 Tax=Neptuniibacter sp. TaxID=1962643 RepID=UPI002605859B|nr:TIGR02444 family protein [Neptuniibacter sp.]MCP4597321.1 TIGR02444 family protein [Neptuniibacter sp.]
MDLKNELWDFALEFYQQPEIEAFCLSLQEQYGLSINRLIFSSWCGCKGLRLRQNNFSGEAAEWQNEITHPLRAVRYKVREQKEQFPGCYQKLRQAELACEQVELALLYDISKGLEKAQANAQLVEANLHSYLKSEGLEGKNTPLEPLIRTANYFLSTK